MAEGFCCCCGDELDGAAKLIPITLAIPDYEEQNMGAVVCGMCGIDFENTPEVIEALINARITRLRHPEKQYTPKRDSDSGPRNEQT